MSAAWQDRTSYSRGERGKREPSVWELDLNGLRVTVHRLHGIDDEWFGSCHAMAVDRKQLSSDLTEAKREFLTYLKNRAWNWADKIAAVEAP
jgi:hypothetical protein